jgi:GNAT superfamily N-acetyltransferase
MNILQSEKNGSIQECEVGKKLKSLIKIRPISLKDISEVEQLLAIQLGDGFIDASTLIKCVNQSNYIGLVAEYDRKIYGAALGYTFPVQQITRHLKTASFYIKDKLHECSEIGVTKTTAILPGHTGKGIGSLLIAERMKWFEQNCDAVILPCWEESNGAAKKILKKTGFQYITTIPEYWKKDSLTTYFNCARCGQPPCLCTASIYLKYIN